MSNARQLAANLPREGGLSNRNLIINGAMQVAQRGNSFTAPANGAMLLDRWRFEKYTTAVVDAIQSSGPSGICSDALKLTVTTVGSNPPSAGDYTQIKYAVEGYDIEHVGLGTSSCKSLTLSFYVKCSTTGTLPLGLSNQAGNVVYPAKYDVTQANVWQRHVINIDPITDGTWLTGNSSGLEIRIGLEFGSTYSSGTPDAWASTTGFIGFTTTYTNPVAYTSGATWEITGVQLEVGDTATPFEHRSYSDQLHACQRYFQWNPTGGGAFSGGGQFAGGIALPVALRSTPTISLYDGVDAIDELYVQRRDMSVAPIIYDDSPSIVPKSSYSLYVTNVEAGAITRGAGIWMAGHWTMDAEL